MGFETRPIRARSSPFLEQHEDDHPQQLEETRTKTRNVAHNLTRGETHVEQEQPQATTPDDPKSMYYIGLRVAEKAPRIQTTQKQHTHRRKAPSVP